jgi:hypothetical protein
VGHPGFLLLSYEFWGIKKAADLAALISTLYFYFINFGVFNRQSFWEYFLICFNALHEIGVISGLDKKSAVLALGPR